MADFTAVRIDDVEGAFGGALRRVRAATQTSSFGMQVVDLPPDSGDLYPSHSHDEQEEVFAVLRGSGELVVDGEATPIDPDVIVRVAPGANRQLRSGPDGLRVLALGGTPGKAYEPPSWSEFGGGDPQPTPA